jgi:hypothetical protein
MAIVNSRDRKNDGSEFGILGGRPAVYNWEDFAKEMKENDPDNYYLSPHMKKWMLENWGKTEDEIQRSFRKTLWAKFGKTNTSVSTPEKAKAWRQSPRGRLSKKIQKFKQKTTPLRIKIPLVDVSKSLQQRLNSFNRRTTTIEGIIMNLKDLVEHLEEKQQLNLENNTVVDYYSGEVLDLVNDTWQLDHIDPDGGNGLENACITREQYNQMKNAWTIEETLDACEKLLKNLRPNVLKNSS